MMQIYEIFLPPQEAHYSSSFQVTLKNLQKLMFAHPRDHRVQLEHSRPFRLTFDLFF